ncbi:hypothetical protein D1816_04755 [Aquimarina sp. AD10]|uniref:hypothetical protein n=1 Tax=Aquimarina sp. AD10 TaxID=1714849 RepID=UPI000E471656|nr:hypothetical protein [Aquimarina sp. AD10]AXT59694.1 hypothetical protein D1816_04755 [Aquimarina sp. AD10]RKM97570.1 hypothetical protein D7033_14335 [Aquimarina sp. AD10]
MKAYSYFLKPGKGTYGLGNNQINVDDVYVNHRTPDLSFLEELVTDNQRLRRKVENLQQAVFYNRVVITYDLLEDFSNSASYSTFPMYYNQANGIGRLLVDTSKISVDFKNTTVFIKDSAESSSITTRNRRFKVTGDSQVAYGNYVWYRCDYVPANAYAYDNLGSFMPNNTTWFLAYQREDVDVLPVLPEYTINIQSNALKLLKDGVEINSEDLSLYIDDTNLSRLTSGVVDSDTGIATFTRDDNSTFTVDFSSFINGNTPVLGLNDLTDAQSDTTNILLGTRETPDSIGETRGERNVVVGKGSILDGVGNDNVILGSQAFSGLGTNGNNGSDNNVVIGSKTATDRVQGDNNVIIGGNSVQGDGSGSNNIVLGANVDIGGFNINNLLNIGDTILGNLVSKIVTFVKIRLTGLSNGSFNDSVLTINSNNEVEKLVLQNFVNIKVYSYNVNPQLNLAALISQETSYNGGNGIVGAFSNAGANRLTVAGKYSTFFHATTGTQNPTSVRYEYRFRINNGLFTSSTAGDNPVDSVLVIANEDLTINGIIDESTFIETQLFPAGQVFGFVRIEKIAGVETKTSINYVLRSIDNTQILNASDANISVMVRIIKTYADANNDNNDNNNVSLRRDNVTTFIERLR